MPAEGPVAEPASRPVLVNCASWSPCVTVPAEDGDAPFTAPGQLNPCKAPEDCGTTVARVAGSDSAPPATAAEDAAAAVLPAAFAAPASSVPALAVTVASSVAFGKVDVSRVSRGCADAVTEAAPCWPGDTDAAKEGDDCVPTAADAEAEAGAEVGDDCVVAAADAEVRDDCVVAAAVPKLGDGCVVAAADVSSTRFRRSASALVWARWVSGAADPGGRSVVSGEAPSAAVVDARAAVAATDATPEPASAPTCDAAWADAAAKVAGGVDALLIDAALEGAALGAATLEAAA